MAETELEPATSSLGKRHGSENNGVSSPSASIASIQNLRQFDEDLRWKPNGDYLETLPGSLDVRRPVTRYNLRPMQTDSEMTLP